MCWVRGLGPHVAAVRAGSVVAFERTCVRGVLVKGERIIHGHGQRVGRQAIDGDGDGCAGSVPILVCNGVVERFGQRLAVDQRCHRRIGIVQCVAVGAVGVERDGAIGADARRAHRATRNARHRASARRTVRADGIVGEGVAGYRGRAFGDAVGIGNGGGHVIDDLDDQIAKARLCTGAVVRHHQRDGVGGLRVRWR